MANHSTRTLNILGRSDLESFEIAMRLSLTGIGAELRFDDGYARVQRLLPGGPGQMSGKMNVADRIAAVAQGKDAFVDTVDIELDKVVEMARAKGYMVRLQIIPAKRMIPQTQSRGANPRQCQIDGTGG